MVVGSVKRTNESTLLQAESISEKGVWVESYDTFIIVTLLCAQPYIARCRDCDTSDEPGNYCE